MRDPRKQARIDLLRWRLARADNLLIRLRQLEGRFPWLRLGTLLAGLAVVFVTFQLVHALFGWLMIFLAMLAFAWVTVRHQRVIDALERAAAARRVLATHLARAELDWSGIPPGIDFPAGPEHPFALDLYLPQLHRLMDTAASLGGSLRLAAWLAQPIPDPDAIHRRQTLVRELLARPAFRARLLVDGALITGPSAAADIPLLRPPSQASISTSAAGALTSKAGPSTSSAGTSTVGTAANEVETPANEVGTSTSVAGTSTSVAGTSANEVGTPASVAGTPANEVGTSTSVAGTVPFNRWDGAGVLRWLEQHNLPAARLLPFLLAAGLLALVNLILFALNALDLLPPFWIATFAGYLMLQSLKYRESSEVFDEAYTLARHLQRLRAVLIDLQAGPYPPGSRLSELCRECFASQQRPDRALRRIGWIVTASSLRYNPFLALLLNMLMPWDLFFAYQLERFKNDLRGVLPAWLEAWYELEALISLAGFAAVNPETTFPELLDPAASTALSDAGSSVSAADPILEGLALGHPLIPDRQRVTNDFHINRLGEVVIITGSNMSGKSTFLRTVGVNLALAYAGSTVQAARLRVLPMRLFTSMTLSDSLSDGISFFYAEVRRLRALLDQLESPPVPADPSANSANPTSQSAQSALKSTASLPAASPLFFLVDEIFRGTNNRERQLGSRAYTEALAGKHGAGLISTHDLELVHLAEAIPLVSNQHFREDILDGQMIFDYKIRPGSSPTTNALRIMALAGLPVPKENR